MARSYGELFRLDGRTALVTGSSRGIGAAIAKGMAEFGARLVVHGQTPDSMRSTAGDPRIWRHRGGRAWRSCGARCGA